GAGSLFGGGHGVCGAAASIAPNGAKWRRRGQAAARRSVPTVARLRWQEHRFRLPVLVFFVRRARCSYRHVRRIAALPGGCHDEADILPQRSAEDTPALEM
ncbi:MAG TPA: hypothetical protein PK752_19985, partial [Accumulibacter sp.]|uniref:hypothetical protein n=1 Tax=Accumulibacter sp. TaxID=2053492 RepID=UPI002D06EC3A